MEIMICCGGDPEIAELIDQMWIDIERVPCVGEDLKLFVGDYHLLMKVASVMTMYVQKGNEWFGTIKHGKAEYVVTVEDEEIVEKYNENNNLE